MRNNIKYLYDVDDTVFGTGYRISLIRAINKPAANQLEAFFKKRPHEIYGSSSQYAQGSRNNRPPADLDVAINNVMKVAPIVASNERFNDSGTKRPIKKKTQRGFGKKYAGSPKV